jgi:PAS domain-containing protein
MSELRTTVGSRAIDPLRQGTDTSAAWDSHIPFLHPEDQEETRRVWSECLRTGRPCEVSFRARNAEGGYRRFLSRAEPFERTTKRSSTGSGSTSTSKNASKPKSNSAGAKSTWQTRRDSVAPASLPCKEAQIIWVRGSRSDLRVRSGDGTNARSDTPASSS